MGRLSRVVVWVLQRLGYEGVYVMTRKKGCKPYFWMFGRWSGN